MTFFFFSFTLELELYFYDTFLLVSCLVLLYFYSYFNLVCFNALVFLDNCFKHRVVKLHHRHKRNVISWQGKLDCWGEENYYMYECVIKRDTSRRSLSFTLILAYNYHVIVLNAFLALAHR